MASFFNWLVLALNWIREWSTASLIRYIDKRILVRIVLAVSMKIEFVQQNMSHFSVIFFNLIFYSRHFSYQQFNQSWGSSWNKRYDTPWCSVSREIFQVDRSWTWPGILTWNPDLLADQHCRPLHYGATISESDLKRSHINYRQLSISWNRMDHRLRKASTDRTHFSKKCKNYELSVLDDSQYPRVGDRSLRTGEYPTQCAFFL